MAAVNNSSSYIGLEKSSPVLEQSPYLPDCMVEVLSYKEDKWQFKPSLYLDGYQNWHTSKIDILTNQIKIYYYKDSDSGYSGTPGSYVEITNSTFENVTLSRLYGFADGKATRILAPGKFLKGNVDTISGIFKAATGTPKGADDNKEDP